MMIHSDLVDALVSAAREPAKLSAAIRAAVRESPDLRSVLEASLSRANDPEDDDMPRKDDGPVDGVDLERIKEHLAEHQDEPGSHDEKYRRALAYARQRRYRR